MDCIELKAQLLCLGLKPDTNLISLFKHQNPDSIWKTGNNGCFLSFDNTQVLASIVHNRNKTSPFSFSVKDKCIRQGEKIVKSNVFAPIYPDWYNTKLSTGKMFSEVFLLEGERFFHQAYKGCDYMAFGKGCKFCSTGIRNEKEAIPFEIGEAAAIIGNHFVDAHICLGGGTYLPISYNVKYFSECIKEIRKRNEKIPIWIEMVPPTIEELNMLIDLGATSFGFNIEIWDDNKRKKFCPGKSSLSKSHYLNILEHAASLLPNRVGSCLIVGLDTPQSIQSGIDELVSIGVHPCLLPFKPFDGAETEKQSLCDSKEFVELSYYCVEQMHNNGLDLLKNQGCLLCDCCTIMHDIWQKKYLGV